MESDTKENEAGFESFKDVLRSKEPTAADLKREIDIARCRVEAADTLAESLRDARRHLLLADDEKRQEHRTLLAQTEHEIEDLNLYLEAMEDRLPAAEIREERARRIAIYEAAIAQRDAAAKQLEKEYPEIGRRLQKLARAVFEADIAVERANDEGPEDYPRIAMVEETVRDIPDRDAEILSEEIVELWHYANRPGIVPDSRLGQVRANPDGKTGQLALRRDEFGQPDPIMKRPFRKVVTAPGVARTNGGRLSTLHFPGLNASDPDFLAKPKTGGFGHIENRRPGQALHAMGTVRPVMRETPEPKIEFLPVNTVEARG